MDRLIHSVTDSLKNRLKIGLWLMGFLLIGHGTWASTAEQIATNRYSLESLAPTLEQQQLLSVVVDEQFPETVQKVGDAIHYLLNPNGFRLVLSGGSDDAHYILLNQPLPAVHRQLGPMRLETALNVLGGEGFQWVVNTVNRTIAYQLNPRYQKELAAIDIQQAKQLWEAQPMQEKEQEKAEKFTTECDRQSERHFCGPVKSGETLLEIAKRLQISGVSTEQVMMALLTHNPHAFPTGNINRLLAQVVLHVPDQPQITQIASSEASDRVRQHDQQWKSNPHTVMGD